MANGAASMTQDPATRIRVSDEVLGRFVVWADDVGWTCRRWNGRIDATASPAQLQIVRVV